jgi:hypothetical protein
MPALSRLAAASARGFGQFISSFDLTTVTFTSNGTWVAPTGVGEVVTLTGSGSPGVSDSSGTQGVITTGVTAVSTSPSSTPITRTWQDYISYTQGFINTMNSGVGVQTITVPYYTSNKVDITPSNTGFQDLTTSGGSTLTYVASPTGAVIALSGFPPTGVSPTSVINYADAALNPVWGIIIISYTAYFYGYAGSDSSGLGYTFPGGAYAGGTGYPAVPATYSNIPVTPGASYSIVVPSGGSVSISYFA